MNTIRKIFILGVITMFLLCGNVIVSASQIVDSNSRLYVNGIIAEFSDEMQLINADGSLMVPLRDLAGLIDDTIEVSWDEDSRMVTIIKTTENQTTGQELPPTNDNEPQIDSITPETDEPQTDSITPETNEPQTDSITPETDEPQIDSTDSETDEPQIDSTDSETDEPQIDSTDSEIAEPQIDSIDSETSESEQLQNDPPVQESSDRILKLWISQNDIEIGNEKTSIDGAAPLIYNGKTYVPLRSIAQLFDMVVEWEPHTKTALIMEKELFERIKSINEKSSGNNENMDKVEMEASAEVKMSYEGSQLPTSYVQNIQMRMDTKNKFLWMIASVESPLAEQTVEVYDNGENMFINLNDTWTKQPSSMVIALDAIGALNMNQKILSNMNDLMYAGTNLYEDADGNYVLEGNVFVKEIYDAIISTNNVAQTTTSASGDESGTDGPTAVFLTTAVTAPTSIYVRQVIDSNTFELKSMSSNYEMSLNTKDDSDTEQIILCEYTININKYNTNPQFESKVPDEVINSAVQTEQ